MNTIKRYVTAAALAVLLSAFPVQAAENALLTPEFNETVYQPELQEGFVDYSWTPCNVGMFSFAIAGQAGDVWSTQDALDRGLVEANPIFGDDPSTGLMILVKTLFMGGAYAFTEYYLVPIYGTNARNVSYGMIGTFGTAAAIWNVNQ